ncbi:NADP-dependent oxidoreductase [Larkinella terrae]|uniref:Zinc-binding dehydrogenase n=1 Tax=Larkinella terrae TaxID=2025311 RepID=A0A7K0EFE6_9BACT|nr:NADP-dependent oxidoreductase [Larkinella terrae]MRS60291.1 zinc-binding dehydrogenase [Larkinella terrae]
MKALQYNQYGGTDVLNWVETPIPIPGKEEVVVAVKAATINPTDNKMRAGELKLLTAFKSFPMGMGIDFAGIISAVGADVTEFKIGDEVMGLVNNSNGHSFADFTVANVKHISLKPSSLRFDEAACIPMNAGTALAAVDGYVKPVPGLEILINGAAGGIGLFILQLCKLKGAIVTGTCGAESIATLQELGADEVIDYKTTDIYSAGKQYDVILDTSGKMSFDQAKAVLKDHGSFCTMTPNLDSLIGQIGSVLGGKKEKNVLAVPSKKEMDHLQVLIENGQLKPVVGKTVPMSQAVEVLSEFENGKLKGPGKLVLINQ